MKLLLIGYYHLAEGFLGAMNALRNKYKYDIDFFPLSAYLNIYNTEDTIAHLKQFILKKDCILLPEVISTNNQIPNVILWWNFSLDRESFLSVYNQDVPHRISHIFYSWDDPFQTELMGPNDIFSRMDIVFTCCKKSIQYYMNQGCKTVYYAKPGFDPQVHHDIEEQNYDCDVSIVCTNLYDQPMHSGKAINRKHMLDLIKNDHSIKFCIYGPNKLHKMYPDNYAGYVNFKDTHRVFNKSKINICTHVRKNTGYMYINERVCQILGSGGLLFIDNVAGLDKIIDRKTECVVIDETNILAQIHSILDNYAYYEVVKKYGRQHALATMTWDGWADIVHQGITTLYTNNFAKKNLSCEIAPCHIPLIDADYFSSAIKKMYLLCQLIRKSLMGNMHYIKKLADICNTYDIDINKYLQLNIDYIRASIPLQR